jgi:uncharacterized alkaline shock family protein YloU
MNTDMGQIIVDTDVIAKYAGTSAVECFGVVGMAAVNVRDGFAKLLGKGNLARGVEVAIVGNMLNIDLHIIVAYGVSISAVSRNLIDTVKYKIEHFTGMKAANITVSVEGVRVIE